MSMVQHLVMMSWLPCWWRDVCGFVKTVLPFPSTTNISQHFSYQRYYTKYSYFWGAHKPNMKNGLSRLTWCEINRILEDDKLVSTRSRSRDFTAWNYLAKIEVSLLFFPASTSRWRLSGNGSINKKRNKNNSFLSCKNASMRWYLQIPANPWQLKKAVDNPKLISW